MRMFLLAVIVIIVSSVAAKLVLDAFQRPADVAFATRGARVDPAE